MNRDHLIHSSHSSCCTPWRDRSTNTDSESYLAIIMPKLHLKPVPAVCNSLSPTFEQKKQNVSAFQLISPATSA